MIDSKEAGIREGNDLRGRRRLRRLIAVRRGATAERQQSEEQNAQKADLQRFVFHKRIPSPQRIFEWIHVTRTRMNTVSLGRGQPRAASLRRATKWQSG